MKDYFIHLLKYNEWATKETAESMITTKEKIDRAEKLLSHIVAAQIVWLNRINRKEAVDPWQFFPVAESIEQSSQITETWLRLLENLKEEGLEKKIEYKNIRGEEFANTIKDILTHVINHSTYHRAQIAQLVRQSGGEPAKTDYIVYQRTLLS